MGTSPAHVMNVNGYVPNPKDEKNTTVRLGMEKALDYMNLIPGQRLKDTKVGCSFYRFLYQWPIVRSASSCGSNKGAESSSRC